MLSACPWAVCHAPAQVLCCFRDLPLCPPHLDMLLGDEPRTMCQQLVDLIKLAQLLRGMVEAKQPLRVTTSLQKLGHVRAHQVGTLVAGGSLWRQVDRAQVMLLFLCPTQGEYSMEGDIIGLTVPRGRKFRF